MGFEAIHHSVQKARKAYFDDGWEDINEWALGGFWTGNKKEIDEEDKRQAIEYLNREYPHRIMQGELYQRQFNKIDGDAGVWRTKQVFYDLMCKYNLFPDYY